MLEVVVEVDNEDEQVPSKMDDDLLDPFYYLSVELVHIVIVCSDDVAMAIIILID